MKYPLVPITLLLLLSTTLSFDLQGCDPTLIEYGGLYALCPFTHVPPFTVTSNQYSIQFSLGTNHVVNCDSTLEIWGVVKQAQTLCADAAASTPKYSLIDQSSPSKGFKMDFEPNVDGDTTYTLSVVLQCNPDITNPLQTSFTVTNFDTTAGAGLGLTAGNINIQVTGNSAYGCPVVSFGGLYSTLSSGRIPIIIIIAAIGLLFAATGIKLFKVIVFLVVFVLVTILFVGMLYQFSTFGTKPETLWVALAFSILMGAFLAITAVKITGFCFFILGATIGGIGGSILYHAVLAPILRDTAGTAPYYITLGILAVVVGIVYLYIFKGIVIISTSLIGAYIFVRAISEFIGGFPSASSLGNGVDDFTPTVYAYLVGILVVTGVGIFVQYKYHANPEKIDKKEKKQEFEDPHELEKLL